MKNKNRKTEDERKLAALNGYLKYLEFQRWDLTKDLNIKINSIRGEIDKVINIINEPQLPF